MKKTTLVSGTVSLPQNLLKKLLTCFGMVTLLSSSVFAQVAHTSTGAGGNWNVAATWTPATVPAANDPVTIASGSPVTLTAAVTQTNTITVNSGGALTLGATLTSNGAFALNGTLIAGTNIINGTGSFILANNNPITTTLETGNAAGITSSGATGSIENTGTRTFTLQTNYIYNGTVNQVTGNGLPATIATLTINNTGAAGNNIVTLTNNNTTIQANPGPGTLTLTAGIFDIGTGNTVLFNNNSSGSFGIVNNGGNLATTGAFGSDGGTIQVLQANGSTFTIAGPSTTTFFNLDLGSSVGNGNIHVAEPTASSVIINGTLTIQDQQAQWITNAPIYGSHSTLTLTSNGGTFQIGATGNANEQEWLPLTSGTIGGTPGYPNNVNITNIGTSQGGFNNGNGWVPSVNFAINGILTLGDNTTNAQVDLSNVPSFTTGGIVINTGSRLTVPKATLNDNGSWIDNQVVSGTSEGYFINGTSTVNFGGSSTCATPSLIQAPTAAGETFYNLSVVNGAYVKLNSPVTVNNFLTLTSGIFSSSATNFLKVTNPSTAAITGGSSNTYIDGPLIWNLPATAGVFNFPVGATAGCVQDFLPFSLNKTAAASAASVTVQAFSTGSLGTVDATLSALSTTEYWSLNTSAALGAGTTIASVSRPTAIAPLAFIAQSATTSNGVYTSLAGTAFATGVTNSNAIAVGSPLFFTLGSPPIVSTLAATSITTTGATLNGAFNTLGVLSTTSFNYGLTATPYSNSINSIHSQINSTTSKLDSAVITGLIANTLYHYLATDGANSGSDVTFITAPNPPTVGTPTSPTANGITANWTPTVLPQGLAPFTYTVEISSDPTFATGVITQTGISGTSYTFTTLASATQYYYRVEAVNATASSVWSATSTPLSTLISPTPGCTTGNGSPGTTGTITSASVAPIIDGVIDPVWSTVPANPISETISVADEGSGLQSPPNNVATWKTIWDATNLYILVQVQDATLISQGPLAGATNISTLNGAANPWDVDGIEFYLDGNNNKGGAYDNTNDFQLRFNLGQTTVTTGSTGNAPFALLAPRINYKMVVVPGGYLLEAAIPWSGPGGINSGAYPSIIAGNKIGIDFSINDNDGTAWRTAQQGWYDGGTGGFVDQYNNTTRFGTATLATCPQPPIVILPTVTAITATGATLGATVTSSGDAALTSRGTGITQSPDTSAYSNAIPEGGTAVSIYSGPARTGLLPQTKYYFRGYADNANNETGTSNVDSFYTLSALPITQPILTASGCSSVVLNWNAIAFPPVGQATQTGYLIIRSVSPTVPTTTGITTRVATTQSMLPVGDTLITTIPSGATLTYTDATAHAGVTYNYILVPFTWDGVTADSTYNYFVTTPSGVSATPNSLPAPVAVEGIHPTCAVPTGSIIVTPIVGQTYSIDGINYFTYPNAVFTNLVPNTYQVTTKNAGGCVSLPTPVIIDAVPGAPAAPIAVAIQATCTVSTGSITITPVAGLTYSIDGTNYFPFNDPTFTGLAPNTYQVTAENASLCVSPATPVTINPVPTTLPNPTVVATQPTCTVSTGQIDVTSPTGVQYTFDGGTTYGPSATDAGVTANTTYQVGAKDGTCVSAFVPTIINPIPTTLATPTAVGTQPTCTVSTGQIDVTNPTSGVTYSFDGGTTYGPSATDLAVPANTTYQVGVENGTCVSAFVPVVINPIPTTMATPTAVGTQPTCTVSTGQIDVTNPTSGVTYSFDGGTTYGPSATDLAVPPNTTYQVGVENGTCVSAFVPVVIDPIPTTMASPTAVGTQPTCTVSTGQIDVTNPTSGVTYSFDGGTTYGASSTALAVPANTTYQVGVENGTCVSGFVPVTINAVPTTMANPSVDPTQPTCNTPTGQIDITSPIPGAQYSFDGGTTYGSSSSAVVAANSTYSVGAKNGTCTSGFVPVTIDTIPTIPIVTITSNYDTASIINAGTKITLTGNTDVTGIYDWTVTPSGSVDNSGNLITTATPELTSVYTLTVTAPQAGCIGSAQKTVTVKQGCTIVIPNAFTPNGDGFNDIWIIKGLDGGCYSSVTVDVYNRWGSLVYHSDNYTNSWNGDYQGHPVPDATYYYAVKATDPTTNTFREFKGSVTILR